MKGIEFYLDKNRIRVYLIYLVKKYLLKRLLKDDAKPYLERHELLQYAFRVSRCSECVTATRCTHCECDTVGLMNIKDSVCSDKKFGPMLTEQEFSDWEAQGYYYDFKPAEIKTK